MAREKATRENVAMGTTLSIFFGVVALVVYVSGSEVPVWYAPLMLPLGVLCIVAGESISRRLIIADEDP